MLRVEFYETMNGNVVAGDADDESAPLLTMKFSNEFEAYPSEVRLHMLKAAVASLKGFLPGV